MNNNKKHLALILVSLMAAIGPSQADDLDQINYEDDLYVYEDDEFGGLYGDEDFISLATGMRTPIYKAPAVATVITADDIDKMGARTLSEVLETVPGLHVAHNAEFMAPKFQFRGITSTFNPQSLVLLNGHSLKSLVRGDSHSAWGAFPVHAIARVEVIRGPGSALHGADAFSGVVNIITKSASDIQKPELGASYGSFDSSNLWGSYFGRFLGWDYATTIEYQKTDGHNGTIKQDLQTLLDKNNSQAGIAPASYAPGKAYVGFEGIDLSMRFNKGNWQAVTYLQQRTNLETGQGLNQALDPYGQFSHKKFLVDVKYANANLIGDWGGEADVGYYYSDQNNEEYHRLLPKQHVDSAFPDGLVGSPSWNEDNKKIELRGLYKGILEHKITLGVGYQQAALYKAEEYKNFDKNLQPFPDGIKNVADTDEIFIPEAQRDNSYLFVQDVYHFLYDWELTIGARYDNYSDFETTINPRLALVWNNGLYTTTKLLYGRAFRAPSFAELLIVNNPVTLGNPNLQPETIDTIELAQNYQYGNELALDFNIFHYQINNAINFVPDENSSSATAQNIGEYRGIGLEANATYKPNNEHEFTFNYTFVHSQDKVTNEPAGNYPAHQIGARVYSQWSDKFSSKINWAFIGEQKRTAGDMRNAVSSYTKLDLAVTYHINSHYRFELSIKNALDEEIFEPSKPPSADQAEASIKYDIPMSGRQVFAGVTITL